MPPNQSASKTKPSAPLSVLPAPVDARSVEQRKELARIERARFLSGISGAQLRARELPRDLLKVLPFAVAGRIFADVLNGNIKIKTASEAAQMAKIAVEIGRAELGEATSAEPLTSEERQTRIKAAGVMLEEIRIRKEILEAEETGTVMGETSPGEGDAPHVGVA